MRNYICLAIIIYTTVTKVVGQEDCPLGWQTSRTDRSWPCYLLTNKLQRSWRDAQDFCTMSGGSLLKLESQAEMNWVFSVLKSYQGFFPTHREWWIGLHDNPAQKGLMWIDRTVPNTAWLPWGPGEPTTYNHSAACIEYSSGNLKHQDCSSTHFFVCKRPRASPVWCDVRQGWESFNRKCYKVNTKLLSYDDARGECQRQNGDLMFVSDQSTQTILDIFVESRRANMWIGLRYYNQTDGIAARWNGPQGTYVTAQAHFWAIDSPMEEALKSHGEQACVFGKYGVPTPNIWDVGNCSTKMFSVCQKDEGSCASGWIRNGRTCYALNTGPRLSWLDARAYCSQRGAELVHIDSQSTQDFINRNLPNFRARGFDSIWIGLSDGGPSGTAWLWSNGHPASDRLYSNYNGQIPVNRPAVMDCFTIFTDDKNGTWQVAANCSATKNFLCNIGLNQAPKLPTSAPPTGPTPSASGTSLAPFGNWSSDCGPFWLKDASTGYCYQLSDHDITWAEAQSTCAGMGANLASISNYHEEKFIADRLFGFSSPALWIGMNSLNSRQGYEWLDGTGFGYMNWAPGEPNNYGSNEHCAEFIAFQEKQGMWNDVNCNSRRGYICKKPSSDFSTTPQPTMPSVPASQVYGCPNALWRAYGRSCFLIRRNASSWHDANTFCQNHNFNLASVADENEQNFLFSQLPVVTGHRDQFWIGLTDRQQQMNFRWTDGSAVGFTNWASGEPNNNQNRPEDCVTMYHQSGQWNDELCDSPQVGFVCKTPRALMPRGTPQYDYRQQCPQAGSVAYGYSCYLKVTSIMTQPSAGQVCAAKGGHLAVIHDRFQQAFLASQIASHSGYFGYFWIGLAHNASGQLQWTTGDSLDFTAWSGNHTGNDNTSCIAMKTGGIGVGLWVDMPCPTSLHFLCEFPRPGFSTMTIPTTPTTAPLRCPAQWSAHGSYCYKAYAGDENRRTWLDARDYCKSLGADLLSLHSNEEERFAFSYQLIGSGHFSWLYHADTFWIGLNDFDTEKAYQWSDGSAVTYTNWGRGEPNDASGADDCVEYNKFSANWNDNNCYIAKPFVCKIRKGAALKVAPVTTTKPDVCAGSPGWKEYNGSCYYISPKYGQNSRLSWFDAQKYCLQAGGHLASAHAEQDNNFLVTLMSMYVQKNVWIGLTDLGVNQFGWSDGTPMDYTKWSGNEPNDAFGSEHCGQIKSSNGYWNDFDCSELYNFICKKPVSGATTGRVPATTLTSGGCPAGFTGVYNDNKCYKVVGSRRLDDRLNYTSAVAQCRQLGPHSDLSSISNHQQLVSLIVMVNGLLVDNSAVWIGLNDMNNNRRFTWQDSSRVDLNNWDKGQPLGGERCVQMYTDGRRAGRWSVMPCNAVLPYVCEAYRDSHIADTTPVSVCKAGYVSNVMDCYKLQTTPLTWADAKAACASDQAALTSVMSVFEQAFIDTIAAVVNSSVWIGLGDPQLTGTFTWTDGYPVLYTSWDRGEPTYNHDESCVASRAGFWNDTLCSIKFPSICKISFFPHTAPAVMPTGYCQDKTWKQFDSYCYLIVLDTRGKRSYADAEASCVGQGLQLTSVMSKAEENFLLHQIDQDPNPNANVWLGLRRKGGYFSWSDGSVMQYINWQRSGPSASLDCVSMQHADGRWATRDCSTSLGYVCKAKKLPPTSPPPTTTTMTPPSTQTASSSTTPTRSLTVSQSTSKAGRTPAPSTRAPGGKSTTSSTARPRRTQGPGQRSNSTFKIPGVPQPNIGKQHQPSGGELSGGAVAAIVVGTLALMGFVALALLVVKRRSNGRLFSFTVFQNQEGFENAAYDKSMDSVKISNGGPANGQINGHGHSVGFQDFDHSDA